MLCAAHFIVCVGITELTLQYPPKPTSLMSSVFEKLRILCRSSLIFIPMMNVSLMLKHLQLTVVFGAHVALGIVVNTCTCTGVVADGQR